MSALKQELTAEMESLEAERQTLELRRALVPLQRESATLRLDHMEPYIRELKQRAEAALARDAAREVDQAVKAAREAETAFPDLGAVAREVEELVPRLWGPNGVLAVSQEITKATELTRERSDRLGQAAAALKSRYRAAGVFATANEWLGQFPNSLSLSMELQRTRLRGLWLLPQVGGLIYEELRLQQLSNAVGRACFIAALLCVLVAFRRALHPKGPLVASLGGSPDAYLGERGLPSSPVNFLRIRRSL